ncbi:hypothetical protein CYMTET_7251 [Cymbomonas tetramitiformis]|uniref:Uncharacterized protein n=1 Tax=Cymbomonas tetramitiformis TaxID=36881 RepID=A0AAE0GVD2_9CHLO|nr:hypothetical protein CYMTET_7251 [Cymbomonas tetramitiformis]
MTGEVEKTVVYERGSVQWVQMHVQEDTAREILGGLIPARVTAKLARHQRAEWAQYFRFPDVSAWEERSIAADDYLEPRGYQIQLLFCPTIAEDEVRLGASAAEDG